MSDTNEANEDFKQSETNSYLDVVPKKTDKSKIKTTPAMDAHHVPKHPVSMIVNAKSGGGKTQLILHLLGDPALYKNYFDLIFLFSETAKEGCDDLYAKHADIPEEHIFAPNKAGLEQLDHIIKTQKAIIKERGSIAKAPKILVIFDDIAHSRKFLASRQYLLLHIANRHFNISTFSLTQSYVKIPRSARCQVGAIMFFNGCTNTEKDHLIEEHCPANHSKKEFLQIIDHATAKKYDFLFINKQAESRRQYRKTLKTVLELNK